MGARIVSTRVIGTALVVLCGLGASGSLAGEGTAGGLGPLRQGVAQRDGFHASVDGPIGSATPCRLPS